MTQNQELWRMENEGNLARTWQERLKPQRKAKVRRRLKRPWLGTAVWIFGLWLAGFSAAGLAIQSMTLSYHYDQLNQQYDNMTRQNQTLAAEVASLTSAPQLARDAARLHVTVVHPKPAVFSRWVRTPKRAPSSWIDRVTAWIQGLGRASGQ